MLKLSAIRPFNPTDEEYQTIVELWNTVYPYYLGSADTWKHWDLHRNPDSQFRRHIAEDSGKIVGYGYSLIVDPIARAHRFAACFYPDWDTPENISRFYTYIMQICLEGDPLSLIVQIREDEPDKAQWLRQAGFVEKMRYPSSIFDLEAFRSSPRADIGEPQDLLGIEISSLTELAKHDPDWMRKVYELDMKLIEDVPRPTEFTPPPFENYVRNEFEAPNFTPDLWLIASDEDRYIGMTVLYLQDDNPTFLVTGLTGVLREYRRRGLATALKRRNISQASELGGRFIQTSNEENNPMYQLNLKLGFQSMPADVDWEKKIGIS